MKSLVIGAGGMLGSALMRVFEGIGADRAEREGMRALDACDAGAVASLIEESAAEAVLFPAAQPHVDLCEREPEATAAINVEAPVAAARLCAERRLRFVFYSSDYVFDGQKGRYTETDFLKPLSVYGLQKLEAERRILQVCPSALVLRTSGMYGNETVAKNYALRLIAALREGKEVKAVTDQAYSPTWSDDLAKMTKEALEKGARGVYHATGSKRLTRFEWAQLIATSFALDASLVKPALTAEFDSAGLAPRPADSSLDSSKLAALIGRAPLSPEEGLAGLRAQLA
ncbi:MAG: hypothetical protein AUJ52_08850 [Elusimicrobia bacterium CG1_02_63_36]|nr:MAG: hypothetical protein AUJ52_08850 [Elusimicrobia bacterium CG1_02_63_36]PIP82658.1 MAG: hypothetical protein COR54_13675 [Elusimicrobia bacterium CG22_combo_CG10-13_8_21_14_all_63_91]PJA15940.1 MAG: hypothetical protein COX66_08675 [Elusimicrobia bacterium CG_4_10_14_0_2_um_filter_63_34]PJB26597.1 MAG: hypothetical protein CO113_02640 [Elusimicrobia bacterium CG_4_9_14_3_um_filter_62_55]